MPEGHSIRIAADRQHALLAGRRVRASSPQGRFTHAARIDRHTLVRVEGAGKHLFYHFAGPRKAASILHVHLGRLGGFRYHEVPTPRAPVPAPTAACRLRLSTPAATVDLSGPTACALVDAAGRDAILARLGPDPLRADADPSLAWEKVHRSKKPIGALLLDQSVIAGLGNIFRAEILFRLELDPRTRGDHLTRKRFDAIWRDAVEVMRVGVERGWIITTRPADIGKPLSKAKAADRFYVYRRATCRRCAGPIEPLTLGGRTLYHCPACQRS